MGEWLSILGLGEDGPEAMPPASRAALRAAEVIFGGPRHLALVAAWLGGTGDGGGRVTPFPDDHPSAPSPDEPHGMPSALRNPPAPQDQPTAVPPGEGVARAAGAGRLTTISEPTGPVAPIGGGSEGDGPLASPAGPHDPTMPPPASNHDLTLGSLDWDPDPGAGGSGLPQAMGPTSGATTIPVAGGAPPAPMPDLRPWPVPFSLRPVLAEAGRRVVVLASGDPFWFGAGAGLARALPPGDWRAYPAPSTFALAAARMGWAVEEVACLGLHAAPLARLRPWAAPGARAIVLLRDGAAVAALARWLRTEGFGASRVTVLERLGGPAERVTEARAAELTGAFAAPVAAAVAFAGGAALPCASGRPDDLFAHDGQITKRPVRALALSALAPRPGERLWDIGAGSGSIAIEWLLAHPTLQAVAVEADPTRAARLRANADRLGQDRLILREGRAPEALADLPDPQAVFIGGGAEEALLTTLWDRMAPGTRIVAHAVTLETEALLALWHGRRGGSLLRIELSEAAPLGRKRGWKAAYPVVQWVVTR